jgi:hypothetical protein
MRRNAAPGAAAAAALFTLLLVMASEPPARAQDREPTPWDRGRIRLSITLASDDAFGETYFLAGAGVGYFILSGLEVGLDGVHWFGGDPGISVLSPEVRYVAVSLGWPLVPYVGGFYTHYFIGDPFKDFDTVGGRLGMLFHQGGGLVVGVGGVVERIVSDCNEDCSTIYPEVSIGFTF